MLMPPQAENLGIEFPDNPTRDELVAGAGAIYDRVMAFARGCGFLNE